MTITLQSLQDKLSEDKLQKIHFKQVIDALVKGNTYQDLLGISDEVMQELYLIACSYLEDKYYSEAADCFLFLVALNPLEPNLWIKCGLAERQLNNEDAALEAFSMAMLCDADDPFPHLYSAEIYLGLKRFEEAQGCLNACQSLIDEHPDFAPLQKIIKELQKKIAK